MTYPPMGPPNQGPPNQGPQDPSGQQPAWDPNSPMGAPGWGSPQQQPSEPEPLASYTQEPSSGPPGGYPDQYRPGPYTPQQNMPMSGPPTSGPPTSGPPGVYPGAPMGMGQQPPKSKTPLIMGVLLGVVLLVAVAAVLIFTLGNKDEQPEADKSTDAATSDEPSDDKSEQSDDPDGGDTPQITFTDLDEDIEGDEYSELPAQTFDDGEDYSDCSGFGADSTITDAGCVYGMAVNFKAKYDDQDVQILNLVMVLPDNPSAVDLAKTLHDAPDVSEGYSFSKESLGPGKWMVKASGVFVVATLVTAKEEIDTPADADVDYDEQVTVIGDLANTVNDELRSRAKAAS